MKRYWSRILDHPVTDDGVHWQPCRQIFPRPPRRYLPMLLDSGSLTRRLIEMSHGNFRVQVLEERWIQTRSPSIVRCFGHRIAGERMWSRKVILKGYEQPWVAAHTLIPVSSLDGPLKRLKTIRDQPLGAVLFRDPKLSREGVELARTNDGWGRRSLFYLHGRPLLVAEFFLPRLLQAL